MLHIITSHDYCRALLQVTFDSVCVSRLYALFESFIKSTIFFLTRNVKVDMGLAGFEPATSSARGWHPNQARQQPQHKEQLIALYYKIYCIYQSPTSESAGKGWFTANS